MALTSKPRAQNNPDYRMDLIADQIDVTAGSVLGLSVMCARCHDGMHTDVPNHPQSCLMLHTGEFRFTRPSVGSWMLYGLGSENQSLPGFITISPPERLGGAQNYGNAFLAASYQATRIGEQGTPAASARIGNLDNRHLNLAEQRQQLDLIQSMNAELARKQSNPQLEGVINSFELGFRMQASLPKLMDLSGESCKTLEMYGIGHGGKGGGKRGRGGTDDFGRQSPVRLI